MVCRVCLEETSSILNIFDENLKNYNIAQILAKHLWFEPLPEDPISTDICSNCWQSVNDFNQFYVRVQQAHKIFSKDFNNIPELIENDDVFAKPQITEAIFVKEEPAGNLCFENSNHHHSKEMLETDSLNLNDLDNVKTEEETSLNNECDDKIDDDFDTDDEVIGKKILPKNAKQSDGRPEKNKILPKKKIFKDKAPKNSKQSRKEQKTKLLTKRKTKSVEGEDKAPTVSKQIPKVRKIQHSLTQSELDMIAKHIFMQCELCSYVTKSYNDFMDHYRNEHKGSTANVRCCSRKLTRPSLFIQHALKHEDPEYFKCKECNKVFANDYILQSHILENHAPKESLKYGCDMCPKRFSIPHFLNLHKAYHIPPAERKFVCEDCPEPKNFASKSLLQKHQHNSHLKAVNVCHVCAKEIRDNISFEKHVRSHFEDKRVKCTFPGCDSYVKEDNLRTHIARSHSDNGKKLICQHCNKSWKNRNALTNHIRRVHSNKTYDCELCGKSFRKAITLKEHMAQHTGRALYQCPFCERSFNSNTSISLHKITKHPVEWENLKRMQKQGLSTE